MKILPLTYIDRLIQSKAAETEDCRESENEREISTLWVNLQTKGPRGTRRKNAGMITNEVSHPCSSSVFVRARVRVCVCVCVWVPTS